MILKADADGTLHLPVPPEFQSGKVHVTATLMPVTDNGEPTDIALRKQALKALRDSGGLAHVIADPLHWEREQRIDRPLPGRP